MTPSEILTIVSETAQALVPMAATLSLRKTERNRLDS